MSQGIYSYSGRGRVGDGGGPRDPTAYVDGGEGLLGEFGVARYSFTTTGLGTKTNTFSFVFVNKEDTRKFIWKKWGTVFLRGQVMQRGPDGSSSTECGLQQDCGGKRTTEERSGSRDGRRRVGCGSGATEEERNGWKDQVWF